MQRHALDIAGQYQVDKDTWNTAAQNLRAPYWDWATNSLPPAEVISLQSVNIITFDGSTISVPNPLFQYTFHPIDPSFRAPYSHWPMTLRHADSTSPNATTDVQSLTEYDLTLPLPSLSHSQLVPKHFGIVSRGHYQQYLQSFDAGAYLA
jgi:tyrosinase